MDRSFPRKLAILLVVLPLWASLVGLGGNRAASSITDPSEQHEAVLTDADGTAVSVSGLTAAGEVSLVGRMGRGELRVRFANISGIELTDDPGDFASAKVALSDGSSVTLLVRDSLTFYGQTGNGLFQIRARDLKSVSIGH